MSKSHLQIEADDGSGHFAGYLALPPGGSGPGLVIAQEIFGVNATMREAADAYAAQGYVVLVPDLFWRLQPGIELGYTPEDWQRAFELYQGFDEARGVDDLQAAISVLRARPEVRGKVGVLGYCLGGKLAYLAACRTDADASVSYYGVGIENALGEAARIKRPLLMHVAALDKFCPPEAQAKIVAALGSAAHVELHVYPGVDHAFVRQGGDHFDAAAAQLADARSAAALKAALA